MKIYTTDFKEQVEQVFGTSDVIFTEVKTLSGAQPLDLEWTASVSRQADMLREQFPDGDAWIAFGRPGLLEAYVYEDDSFVMPIVSSIYFVCMYVRDRQSPILALSPGYAIDPADSERVRTQVGYERVPVNSEHFKGIIMQQSSNVVTRMTGNIDWLANCALRVLAAEYFFGCEQNFAPLLPVSLGQISQSVKAQPPSETIPVGVGSTNNDKKCSYIDSSSKWGTHYGINFLPQFMKTKPSVLEQPLGFMMIVRGAHDRNKIVLEKINDVHWALNMQAGFVVMNLHDLRGVCMDLTFFLGQDRDGNIHHVTSPGFQLPSDKVREVLNTVSLHEKSVGHVMQEESSRSDDYIAIHFNDRLNRRTFLSAGFDLFYRTLPQDMVGITLR